MGEGVYLGNAGSNKLIDELHKLERRESRSMDFGICNFVDVDQASGCELIPSPTSTRPAQKTPYIPNEHTCIIGK